MPKKGRVPVLLDREQYVMLRKIAEAKGVSVPSVLETAAQQFIAKRIDPALRNEATDLLKKEIAALERKLEKLKRQSAE